MQSNLYSFRSGWAHFTRKPKTKPNRTEKLVFSVVRFGFGFCAGELRLRCSTSVLMFTEPNTRNQPNCNRQDSKSQAEASA